MNALEAMDTLGPLIVQAMTIITPFLNAAAPALGLAQDHPFLTATAFLAGGGTLANLLARALNRVPLAPLFSALEAGAALVSKVGNAGYLRVLYGPFEEFLVKVILGGADAVARGLRLDNGPVPKTLEESQGKPKTEPEPAP